MADYALPKRAGLVDRWPTAVGLVAAAAVIAVVVLVDPGAKVFGSVAVMMAGIYLFAYALGRPATVWLAGLVLSTVAAILQVIHNVVDPAVGMTVVVVLLWLWTVVRRRFTDGAMFSLQTAGMVGFGAVTLMCLVLAPRWGTLLAGLAFLAHAAWDAYHYRINKVVHRTYAEFCGVFDLVVGPTLIVAAVVAR